MNDITAIKKKKKGLLSILHGKGGDIELPEPFEREIFLFDTYVAGTSHIEGMNELEPYINIGDHLTFQREPNNPYDKEAILVKNKDGIKIGYVPQKDNVVFARLMDAGKLLFGKITSKEIKNSSWVKIDMKIYLKE